MCSAKLRKISKTIEMVEIFICRFVYFPQLKLWANSLSGKSLNHSFNCGKKCKPNLHLTTLVV